MRIFIGIALISAMNLSFADDSIDCEAFESEKFISAVFPLKKNRIEWDWYRVEVTPERSEYAWIAEAGVITKEGKNKDFRGSGMAFAASLGTANLTNFTPISGSLYSLIKSSQMNAYLTKRPNSYSEREAHLKFMHRSRVAAEILDDEAIVLTVTDRETFEVIKKERPTHIRMKAVLPYPGESYECLARIQNINNSTKIK